MSIPVKKSRNKKMVSATPVPKKGRRTWRIMLGGPSFFGNLMTTILIFLILMSAYSLITSFIEPTDDIPLSAVAADVADGKVKSITVKGDSLNLVYTDESAKTSRKDSSAGLPETLATYGVTPAELAKVSITIQGQSGFEFWFLTLVPIILPLLFIGFIFWFLSRQVRGAGMQAFSFGQSKARVTDPADSSQRVTFADVAGAREAKEELLEIVDFLKSPKKFLDIGARIPKGIILMGAPGTGKCITGDTLLTTNKGLMPIRDVPKYFTVRADATVEGLEVASVDPANLSFDKTSASHWYDLGEQETRIVETDIGARVEGTAEHPIVVVNSEGMLEFKRLDEINEGEHVVISSGARMLGSHTQVPDAEAAYLLGILVGDGCLTIKDRIIFSSQDAEVIERMQAIARKHLGTEFTKTSSRPYDWELRSIEAKATIRSWGIEETYARHKRIPEWIRIAPEAQVTAFLSGLFDADGSVEKYGSVSLSSASKTLIEEVHATLLNLGIVARKYERRKKYNGELQYYIAIYADFVESFDREIGFSVKRKHQALAQVISRQRNTNINSIPNQSNHIKIVWQEAVSVAPRDRAFYAQSLYKNAKRYMSGERYPSVAGMRTFIAGTTELAPALIASQTLAYLERLSSGDFFFTRISSVSKGRARVYDLTVPNRHNFVANGFINHNTLLARAVAGEAGVPFFSISGSEFVEMFVGVGASVTGDTPVLVKINGTVALKPIAEVVDAQYAHGEAERVKKVSDLEVLGFAPKETGFRGVSSNKQFFGNSRWSPVCGVYRHKTNQVYRITYLGGELRTTGDHSVFVREKNMVRAKRADELRAGDALVNIPFHVRGAFMPGIGTAHATRAHAFEETEPLVLDIYGAEAERLMKQYEYARATIGAVSSYAVADELSISQTSVVNWRNGTHLPRLLSTPTAERTPDRVIATEELMRLLGYYAAEGDVTDYGIRLTFGLHEADLHTDAVSLFKFVFNQDARREPHPETNSLRVIISSRPLADFFKRHCGTGSKHKRMPAFLWTLPKRYFLAYLEGYSRGDGYTTKEGKLSITSVSYEHIRELAWLCAMHGIATGIRAMVLPAGRVINGGKPLPETRAWNLIIGKTSHPFLHYAGTGGQAKRPIVESVSVEPYEGYVYDFCGCDNEAFFGGEKPLLLHNSRVRDLFQLAKKAAPAIIFVDEIDAVGRVRGTGVGGGNDEREQTLNQILVEMDGFEPTEKVVVMAATNRPDVLDPALLRPGRFDRRVTIDLPDRRDREEILKIHAHKKPLGPDVALSVIAERTPGFSGAELYSLMNEGAILAARENRTEVTQYDLIRSIEKVMLGPERKSHLLSKKEKEITAYHETGHALVSSILENADPVHKISIISRGRAAGYTLKLPFEDRKMQSKKQFLDDIAATLGGYVAEEMMFDDITTGSSNDLMVVTALARDMVARYGMSEKIGPVAFGDRQFGNEPYSEQIAAQIDAEVSRIVDEAKTRAAAVINKHRKALDAIAKELTEKETIERADFEQILVANGITPKKKEEGIVIAPHEEGGIA